jgi:hypothetical protein
MAAATAMMLGGMAGAGALGGAIRGKRGTPDQVQRQYTEYADMSPEEQALFDQSKNQYQEALAQQYALDQRIKQLGGLQGQAQDMYGQVLSGQAFEANPREMAMLDQIRQQSLAQTEADLGRFMDQGLQRIDQSAGARGLRGQAVGALQGNLMGDAMRQYQSAANQAELLRSQAQLNLPYQRLQAQAPFMQQGFTYADQLRQQALDNRMQLQNPLALQMLRQERMGEGVSTNMTPGRKGSWLDAFEGGLMGGIAGGQAGMNMAGGIQGMQGMGGGMRPSTGGSMGGGGTGMGGGGYGMQTLRGPIQY